MRGKTFHRRRVSFLRHSVRSTGSEDVFLCSQHLLLKFCSRVICMQGSQECGEVCVWSNLLPWAAAPTVQGGGAGSEGGGPGGRAGLVGSEMTDACGRIPPKKAGGTSGSRASERLPCCGDTAVAHLGGKARAHVGRLLTSWRLSHIGPQGLRAGPRAGVGQSVQEPEGARDAVAAEAWGWV